MKYCVQMHVTKMGSSLYSNLNSSVHIDFILYRLEVHGITCAAMFAKVVTPKHCIVAQIAANLSLYYDLFLYDCRHICD